MTRFDLNKNLQALIGGLFAALIATTLAYGQEKACDPLQISVSTTPVIEQTPGKLKAAIEASRTANPDADVMVIGDSLAAGWREFADRDFAGQKVNWFGVRTEKTQELLWRLDNHVPPMALKEIILIIGTNNLTDRTATPCGIVAGISAVVDALKAKWSTATLRVAPILPRGASYSFREKERAQINQALRDRYGKLILDIDEDRLTCRTGGKNCLNYNNDGLHVNGEGYRILADTLSSHR